MIEAMTASAPGKLILTGEYAVLDGAPALVVAVDRRAVARVVPGRARGSSPYLLAVARVLAERFGDADPAAHAALSIAVDSSGFYAGAHKLGLGSSAAVTVAATALALRARGELDRAEVLAVACAAHAEAQGAQGARGSGADIAAAVHGGTLVFALGAGGPTIAKRTWPHAVRIVPFFTGSSASTARLVAQVAEARTRDPIAVDAALAAVADASRAACKAVAAPADLAPTAMIAAVSLAASTIDRLALATGVPLVPPCVTAARAAMAAFGGTAKTTGAGGGDIGVAVMPVTTDASLVRRSLITVGCQPLQLSVDETGVDLQAIAQ